MPAYEVVTKNRSGATVGRKIIHAQDEAGALALRKAEVVRKVLQRPELGQMIGLTTTLEGEIQAELELFTWAVQRVVSA